jgi:IclR family mhp operon transcriptional activator
MCDLSERTNIPRATLLRILRTLDDAGWVYRYRTNGEYRLTSTVCFLGQHLLTIDRLAEAAGPIMDRLKADFRCTTDIAIFAGHTMRILESTRQDHPRTHSVSADRDDTSMFCSALGRAYLAFCPTNERLAILEKLQRGSRKAQETDFDHHSLNELFANIRVTGYALTEPGHCKCHPSRVASQRAIAVPVRPNGQIRACLGVSWRPDSGSSPTAIRELVPALVTAAQSIADDLGRMESA